MKRPALGHLLGYTALTVILTAGAAQSLSGSNTVFSDDIVDGAVYSTDIRDATITGLDVKNGSLNSADVGDKSIRSADIADDAIHSGHIADGTLTGDEFLPESFDGSSLKYNSLTGEHLGLEYVFTSGSAPPANDSVYMSVECPEGKRPISGGGTLANSGDFYMAESFTENNTWVVRWISKDGTPQNPGSTQVSALCILGHY